MYYIIVEQDTRRNYGYSNELERIRSRSRGRATPGITTTSELKCLLSVLELTIPASDGTSVQRRTCIGEESCDAALLGRHGAIHRRTQTKTKLPRRSVTTNRCYSADKCTIYYPSSRGASFHRPSGPRFRDDSASFQQDVDDARTENFAQCNDGTSSWKRRTKASRSALWIQISIGEARARADGCIGSSCLSWSSTTSVSPSPRVLTSRKMANS